jgi:hypothetical protein
MHPRASIARFPVRVTATRPRAAASALAVAVPLLAALAALPLGVAAQDAPRFPITGEQRRIADQVASAGVPLSALASNAPERYTVKSGDTLWALSSMYLTSPWRWPELWGMNRQQIRNPHLIYPGQTLLLVKGDGRARLELATSGRPGDTVRLAPRVRDLGSDADRPLPSIPNNLIEPFLSQPMVVAASELDRYPRIVAAQDGRVFLGKGDTAYARGFDEATAENYHVFRPARPLYDPDDTQRKSPIAYEAFYVGTAKVARRGEVTSLTIQDSKQEASVGDRLVPMVSQPLVSYVPHPPERAVDGRVVSVYGGVDSAGTQSVVTINRGSRDGLAVGHVLGLVQIGDTVTDTTAAKREQIKLPDERIGELFVFRVFDGLSYALIMRVTQPVKVGDRFTQPDAVPAR